MGRGVWIPDQRSQRSLVRDDIRDRLRLFSGFPSPPLPPYHAFAYTVICTSSSAV